MADRLRRPQDDGRAARPHHPSLRHRRDWQRQLAAQKPELKPSPQTPTRRLTRWVHRNFPRPAPPALEGGARRRPWVPPMDYRDNRPPTRKGGPYCTPIWGPGSTPIYKNGLSEEDMYISGSNLYRSWKRFL